VLILERKSQEGRNGIVIVTPRGLVRVTVQSNGRNRIKLGFDAPKDIRIIRAEAYDGATSDRTCEWLPEADTPAPNPSAIEELMAICRDLLAMARNAQPDPELMERAEAACERLESRVAA